jgi:hypothetical protein
VHIRTAYRHKADADRAARRRARRAAQELARAELNPTITALAAGIDGSANAGASPPITHYIAYYFGIVRAYRAAYETNEVGEPAIRTAALTALGEDAARAALTAAFAAIDAVSAARFSVAAASAASDWAWNSTVEDDDAFEAGRPAYDACQRAVAAFYEAFGRGDVPRQMPGASAKAASEVAPVINAAVDAARDIASGSDGELGLARAAAAYSVYDDTAYASLDEAVLNAPDDDEDANAIFDALMASRAAVAPYTAYVAWLAAAEAMHTIIATLTET